MCGLGPAFPGAGDLQPRGIGSLREAGSNQLAPSVMGTFVLYRSLPLRESATPTAPSPNYPTVTSPDSHASLLTPSLSHSLSCSRLSLFPAHSSLSSLLTPSSPPGQGRAVAPTLRWPLTCTVDTVSCGLRLASEKKASTELPLRIPPRPQTRSWNQKPVLSFSLAA